MQIDAAVEAGIPACGFLDIIDAVSMPLSGDDVQTLLLMSQSVQSKLREGGILLAHRFILSAELLDLCRERAYVAGAAAADQHVVERGAGGPKAIPHTEGRDTGAAGTMQANTTVMQ